MAGYKRREEELIIGQIVSREIISIGRIDGRIRGKRENELIAKAVRCRIDRGCHDNDTFLFLPSPIQMMLLRRAPRSSRGDSSADDDLENDSLCPDAVSMYCETAAELTSFFKSSCAVSSVSLGTERMVDSWTSGGTGG
jgi:hypothetical protein